MAIAPVAIGAVSTGAAGAAVTPAFAQSPAVGNWVVCWVAGTATSATPNPATPNGWAASFPAAAASCGVILFFKEAAGGDAAPTIASQTGVAWEVQLGEFSGLPASAADQVNFGTTGTTSPLVNTLGSADFAPGELVLYASAARYSAAGTKTLANTLNNGASAVSTNNNGTSTGAHYDFGYGITTGHASADSDSFSLTTTNLTRGAVVIASFKRLAVTQQGAASFSASAGLTASAAVVHTGRAAMAATAGLTAAAKVIHTGQATLGAVGGLTASGAVTHTGRASFAATEALSATGTVIEGAVAGSNGSPFTSQRRPRRTRRLVDALEWVEEEEMMVVLG